MENYIIYMNYYLFCPDRRYIPQTKTFAAAHRSWCFGRGADLRLRWSTVVQGVRELSGGWAIARYGSLVVSVRSPLVGLVG